MFFNKNSKFSSARVEDLVICCIQKIFDTRGMNTPTNEECRVIANSCDLNNITRRIDLYSNLKHQGKFGTIDKDLQNQLNLKLLIFDILGQPTKEKRALIRKIISKNDQFIYEKQALNFNNETISNIINQYDNPDRKFEKLLRKADNLLTIQKSKLRGQFKNDGEFELAFEGLVDIYQTHLKRAIFLQEKLVDSPDCKWSSFNQMSVFIIPVFLTIALAGSALADCQKYDRKEYGYWIDQDKDCQNTRNEVLIEESRVPAVFKTVSKCVVKEGLWFDLYTSQQFTNPRKLDIDHVVPLKEAHRSGACHWSKEKKRQFMNYLHDKSHLLAVSARANRQKKDRDPRKWLPANKLFHEKYADIWVKIKVRWGLTADRAEIAVLKRMLFAQSNIIYPRIAKEIEFLK